MIANFLPFVLFFFSQIFPFGSRSGSRRENECGSGSTALLLVVLFCMYFIFGIQE